MIKVAKEYVGQLTFAVSSKGDFGHEIDEFGGTKEEVFAGIFGADGKKYSYGEKKFRFVIPLCMLLNYFSCFCVTQHAILTASVSTRQLTIMRLSFVACVD